MRRLILAAAILTLLVATAAMVVSVEFCDTCDQIAQEFDDGPARPELTAGVGPAAHAVLPPEVFLGRRGSETLAVYAPDLARERRWGS